MINLFILLVFAVLGTLAYKATVLVNRYGDKYSKNQKNDYWANRNREDRSNAIEERVRNALLRGKL